MNESKHTIDELRQWQSLPLSVKLSMTKQRIRDWVREYGEDGVYVAFSGGKDSTVLLDIVRNQCGYKDVPGVFVDTGLEYPEIREFVKTYDNIEWLKPKMNFKAVIDKYGYPMISKEVSECVYGAKKYLQAIQKQIEEENKGKPRAEQRCIYCGEKLGKKGCLQMCNKHYIQYKRWGDPLHSDNKERATIDGYYRDGKTGRREHRIVYEQHYNVKLSKDEVIHHINFVKTDNRIENLYKYENASEHIKAHREYERLMDSLLDTEEIIFVDGKYIKRERESNQTDSNRRIGISTRKLVDLASMQRMSRGGGDNKYRKLNGFCEYAKRKSTIQRGWEQCSFGTNDGNVHKRLPDKSKGDYP